MRFRSYALFSLIGGIAWAAGITLLGYWLGGHAVVRDHIELFVLGVVVVSLIPIAVEYLRNRRRNSARA
jgi:membrane-associated protein